MNDTERGKVLGLIAAAQANLDTVKAILEPERPVEVAPIEEAVRLPFPEPCRHLRTKVLPAMGGGPPVRLCLDCEEQLVG